MVHWNFFFGIEGTSWESRSIIMYWLSFGLMGYTYICGIKGDKGKHGKLVAGDKNRESDRLIGIR